MIKGRGKQAGKALNVCCRQGGDDGRGSSVSGVVPYSTWVSAGSLVLHERVAPLLPTPPTPIPEITGGVVSAGGGACAVSG